MKQSPFASPDNGETDSEGKRDSVDDVNTDGTDLGTEPSGTGGDGTDSGEGTDFHGTDEADGGADTGEPDDGGVSDTAFDGGEPTDTADTATSEPPEDTNSDDTESMIDGTDTQDSETVWDTDEHLEPQDIPDYVPELRIEISDEDKALLEADPFNAEDVIGVFVDENGKSYTVDLNYRGAFALRKLMDSGASQRNWKLKFSKEDKYRNRREWNFNYEPNIRQKLAYDLLKFSGVKMPAPRHVRLVVNGESQGIYLEYEDPDSKDWLTDRFGDNDGDLYKAAHDKPGETPYFADLTYLGEEDESYLYHYDKKTNHKVAPGDYSVLREFLDGLNNTPDEEFAAWLSQAFNTEAFINYLVVGNFIANWDSYPQRPKNFWLYNNPSNDLWTFIPWDVDQTFETGQSELNQMGPYVSIFYQFDEHEPYAMREGEGTERPLVRRMMEFPEFRDAYIDRYKELVDTILDYDYVSNRADALTALILAEADETDRFLIEEATFDIQEFLSIRHANVIEQLSQY